MDGVKTGAKAARSPYRAVKEVAKKVRKRRSAKKATSRARKLAVEKSRETATVDKPRIPTGPSTERDSSLDSLEGLVGRLKSIADDSRSSFSDKIKAIDKIMEVRGLKTLRDMSDLRHVSNEDLVSFVEDIVLTALAPFGVVGVESEEDEA
jgi:hypothetical protein